MSSPVELRQHPAVAVLPGGGIGVLVLLECGSFRADVLIVIYPGTVRIMRRYSRRTWSL